jgi:hypothetical protein
MVIRIPFSRFDLDRLPSSGYAASFRGMWGESMRGVVAALLALMVGGCASGPLTDPLLVRASAYDTNNQILFSPEQPGPAAYAQLFEKILDVMDDTFDIAYANRYDGRIEAQPRIAPGLEQLFKPGSPNAYERTLATFQTYRHRAFVLVTPDKDGYLVIVTVLKELEDVPNPTRETAGGAAFRSIATVDRAYEITDPAIISRGWIPKGRDYALEQRIIEKIRLKLRTF